MSGDDSRDVDGLLGRAFYRTLRQIVWWLARVYCRVEVVGGDRVPAEGGFVFAPVHRSNLDFLMPALVTKRRIRWMAKHSVFIGPVITRLLTVLGAFPVVRDRTDRASIRTCEALLERGEPVVMFPEGRRREGPLVTDLYDGPAFCATRQGVPIVPIGIAGSDNAMPIGHKLIRPAKIVLVVGEPLQPETGTGRVARSRVRAMTSELQEVLQALYDDALSRLDGATPPG